MASGDSAPREYSDDDDANIGVRLKGDLDLDELRDGKGVEFTIDDSTLSKNAPDESSAYFEHAELYKNSELYNMGESDSEDEEDDTSTSFDRLRKKMTPVTEDGGVMKRVLRDGMGPKISEYVEELQQKEREKPEGERRTFEMDDIQIAYHYSGIQETDTEPFDVTYLRDNRPQKSNLNNEFFPGFRIAISSMSHKEVADFLIHPDYAFGAMGCPPRIQPNATLRYRIELVNYWATTELDSYAKMSREDKKLVPVKKLVKLCSKQREEANKLYNAADFKGANYHYGKAIRILEEVNLQDDADEEMQQRALVKLYLNRSLCALKLNKWDHAITFSNRALEIEPKNPKALYRKAKAKMEFGDYVSAKKIVQLARSEYPNDQGIGNLLSEIDSRETKEKKREKLMCQKMFQLSTGERKDTPVCPPEYVDKIKQFKESGLAELKLDARSYTGRELDALAATAADMNLKVLKNKEKEDWISLTIKQE